MIFCTVVSQLFSSVMGAVVNVTVVTSIRMHLFLCQRSKGNELLMAEKCRKM